MRKVIVAAGCAVFAASAAAELIDVKLTPGSPVEKQLTIAAGKFAELCAALKRGQTVSWRFRSEAATDFNIHYHVDQRVEYPEQRKDVKDAGGRLTAQIDEGYCWMWTNRSATPIAVEVHLNDSDR